MKALLLILGAAVAAAAAPPAPAPFQRIPLLEQAYPAGHHTVTVKTVVQPHAEVPPHFHPGVEMAYILTGQGTLRIAGQPDRLVKPGDSVTMPVKAVHSLTNTGDAPLEILSTYVLEAGQPVAVMVK